MNYLFQLAHPAHFHYFKFVIDNLKRDGHNVVIAITSKDILEELVKQAGWQYVNIMRKPHKKNLFGYISELIVRDWRIMCLCLKNNIDMLIGSTIEVPQIGWLLRKSSMAIGEDDADVVSKYINSIAPFVDVRVTPISCNNGKIENKCIHFNGMYKLAYLHPNVFAPNENIVKSYCIDVTKPYFILRFSALNAHHDKGIKGLNDTVLGKLIELLRPHGRIFITSERAINSQFEQYRLNIDPLDVHHILSFATLYIGDSQTMAAEAGILGVPFVRFNDFVGRIGYLRELEDVYHLGYGVKASEEGPERMYQVVEELMNMDNRYEVFQERRKKMLSEKIDCAKFLTWFIENYPESKKIMKENPDYQYNFK